MWIAPRDKYSFPATTDGLGWRCRFFSAGPPCLFLGERPAVPPQSLFLFLGHHFASNLPLIPSTESDITGKTSEFVRRKLSLHMFVCSHTHYFLYICNFLCLKCIFPKYLDGSSSHLILVSLTEACPACPEEPPLHAISLPCSLLFFVSFVLTWWYNLFIDSFVYCLHTPLEYKFYDGRDLVNTAHWCISCTDSNNSRPAP